MATIKDVARRAGVGVATVSRVINQSGPVSAATRQRVLAAIAELQFQPSRAARHLATAQSGTIGVILPYLTRPFFVSVLRGIEGLVAETDYNLHIFNIETRQKRDYYLTQAPFRGRVDGLLIVSLPLHEAHVARLGQLRIPTVLIDTHYPGLPSIGVDNVAGGRLATEHLIGLGHRRIAYIAGPAEPELGFTVNLERRAGYLQALQAHGLPVRDEYMLLRGDGMPWGARMAEALLDLAEPPTAVVAASDELAIGALQVARMRGLQVPEQLAIIGFDDIELARFLGLSTVRQPMDRMGRVATETLMRAMRMRQMPPLRALQLPLEVVVRETTRRDAAETQPVPPSGAAEHTLIIKRHTPAKES